LESIEKEK
jgi:pleiotropic regulator 1